MFFFCWLDSCMLAGTRKIKRSRLPTATMKRSRERGWSEDGAMSARPHNPEGAVKMDFFRRHLFASGIFPSLPYFARCSSGLKTRVIKEKKKIGPGRKMSQSHRFYPTGETLWSLWFRVSVIFYRLKMFASVHRDFNWQRNGNDLTTQFFSCGPEVFLDCPYSDLSCAAINKIQWQDTRQKNKKESASPVTCEVLCLEVQVTQLVDVADVHVLLVDLRFVEILGWNHEEHQITCVEIFKN